VALAGFGQRVFPGARQVARDGGRGVALLLLAQLAPFL
jgi:hypothetical protein